MSKVILLSHFVKKINHFLKNGGSMSEIIFLSHFVKNINHHLKKGMQNNLLDDCPKFGQMSQTPSSPVVWRRSLHLFNSVIHRFRGYPESTCQLNLLTKR